MSEILKFRRGLSKNITTSTTPLSPGAVYITTDERAMYVDIPAGVNHKGEQEAAKRIRIGNFVEYADLTELAKADYYSTEALYLIQNYNNVQNSYALLKYTGVTGDNENPTFVHLNSTSSVVEQFNNLNNRVNTIEGNLNTLTTTVTGEGGINARLVIVEEAIEDHGERIETLEKDVKEIVETSIPKLEEDYEKAIQDASNALQGNIDAKADKTYVDDNFALKTNVYTKTEADNKFFEEEKLTTTLAPYALIETVDATVEDLNEAIEGKVAQGDFDSLEGRVGASEESITGINGKLEGIADTVAAHVQTTAQEIVNTKVGWEDNTTVKFYVDSKILEVNEANSNLSDELDIVKQDLGIAQAAIDAVESQLTGIGSNQGSVKTYIDNKFKDSNDYTDTKIGDLGTSSDVVTFVNGQVSVLDGRLETLEVTTIPTLRGEIDALEDKVSSLEEADDTLSERIEEVARDLNTALNVANAMTYKGTVGDASDLPDGSGTDDKVNAGDTYVASQSFKLNEQQVYAGDLIIANEDQGEDTIYTGSWSIVDTGYIESHENALIVGNNTITLTSHLGDSLGSAIFASESYSVEKGGIEITTSATDKTINFDMVWGTF